MKGQRRLCEFAMVLGWMTCDWGVETWCSGLKKLEQFGRSWKKGVCVGQQVDVREGNRHQTSEGLQVGPHLTQVGTQKPCRKGAVLPSQPDAPAMIGTGGCRRRRGIYPSNLLLLMNTYGSRLRCSALRAHRTQETFGAMAKTEKIAFILEQVTNRAAGDNWCVANH
jgi:hypothetical protein